jgi:proliferating cell nuclear antigen
LQEEDEQTTITLFDKVNVNFAIKYLTQFSKATPLSKTVVLSVCNDAPLLVEYKMGDVGHLRYYLAPKIEEEE